MGDFHHLISLKILSTRQNFVVSTMPSSKAIYAVPMEFGAAFQKLN